MRRSPFMLVPHCPGCSAVHCLHWKPDRVGVLFAIAVCFLGGCRGGPNTDIIERELRSQEDQIFALEDYLMEYQTKVRHLRRENASLEAALAQSKKEVVSDDCNLDDQPPPSLEPADTNGGKHEPILPPPQDEPAEEGLPMPDIPVPEIELPDSPEGPNDPGIPNAGTPETEPVPTPANNDDLSWISGPPPGVVAAAVALTKAAAGRQIAATQAKFEQEPRTADVPSANVPWIGNAAAAAQSTGIRRASADGRPADHGGGALSDSGQSRGKGGKAPHEGRDVPPDDREVRSDGGDVLCDGGKMPLTSAQPLAWIGADEPIADDPPQKSSHQDPIATVVPAIAVEPSVTDYPQIPWINAGKQAASPRSTTPPPQAEFVEPSVAPLSLSPQRVLMEVELLADSEAEGGLIQADITPLAADYKTAGFDGEASLMLRDPTCSGEEANLVRMDFDRQEVAQAWVTSARGRALRLPMPLVDGLPDDRPLELWVRLVYERNGEEKKILSHMALQLSDMHQSPQIEMGTEWAVAQPGQPSLLSRPEVTASQWRTATATTHASDRSESGAPRRSRNTNPR